MYTVAFALLSTSLVYSLGDLGVCYAALVDCSSNVVSFVLVTDLERCSVYNASLAVVRSWNCAADKTFLPPCAAVLSLLSSMPRRASDFEGE